MPEPAIDRAYDRPVALASPPASRSPSIEALDIACLIALRSARDIERNLLVFTKGPMTFALDRRVVGEQILSAAIRRDEAEALSVVEPLDSACDHDRDPDGMCRPGTCPIAGAPREARRPERMRRHSGRQRPTTSLEGPARSPIQTTARLVKSNSNHAALGIGYRTYGLTPST